MAKQIDLVDNSTKSPVEQIIDKHIGKVHADGEYPLGKNPLNPTELPLSSPQPLPSIEKTSFPNSVATLESLSFYHGISTHGAVDLTNGSVNDLHARTNIILEQIGVQIRSIIIIMTEDSYKKQAKCN